MNKNFSDVLCNQVIDVALVVKEIEDTPVSISPNAYPNVDKFINRINSVVDFVQTLFTHYESERVNEEFVNDKMVELMNALVNYKNSYKVRGIAYTTMNSLLDIVKDSFVELNSK